MPLENTSNEIYQNSTIQFVSSSNEIYQNSTS